MTVVITFGTYDLLHIGHVNIITKASSFGDKLIVGVSSDKLNYKKKQKLPIYPEKNRLTIVKSIKNVNHVFLEECLSKKREYILKYKANILIMGDDWKGKFDELSDICSVIYLPRTKQISTTNTIKHIISEN